jgi:hypothetical protein
MFEKPGLRCEKEANTRAMASKDQKSIIGVYL